MTWLIMDSDVLCPASFVRRLVTSRHPNVLLVDEIARQDSEERMAMISPAARRNLLRQRTTRPGLMIAIRSSESLTAQSRQPTGRSDGGRDQPPHE